MDLYAFKMYHRANPDVIFVKTGYSGESRDKRRQSIIASAAEWVIHDANNIIHFSHIEPSVARVTGNVLERYFQERFRPTRHLCEDIKVDFNQVSVFDGMTELTLPTRYNHTPDSIIHFWNTSYKDFVKEFEPRISEYIDTLFSSSIYYVGDKRRSKFIDNWYGLRKGFYNQNNIGDTKYYQYIKNVILQNYFPL